jgi:hypothetical protein
MTLLAAQPSQQRTHQKGCVKPIGFGPQGNRVKEVRDKRLTC